MVDFLSVHQKQNFFEVQIYKYQNKENVRLYKQSNMIGQAVVKLLLSYYRIKARIKAIVGCILYYIKGIADAYHKYIGQREEK